MRVVGIAILAFLALAVMLSRQHEFTTLPIKPMPPVNAPDRYPANRDGHIRHRDTSDLSSAKVVVDF
jgi:hypothetical protein